MKSMKKLVLVGLVLLASVVVLAGCDTPLEPESTTVNEQAGGSENDSVPEVPKYTVTFETEHETAPASITVESGTKLTTEQLKALPDTEDNIFEGWYDGETQAKGGEYTVTKDVTLVARWRNRDTVASVTFSPSDTKFYYGEMVTVTLGTTMEGARIKYRLADSEDWQTYNEAITITSDTTITAYATKEGLKDSAETTATYTVRKLTKISITPPTRTVYSEGEPFDDSGMVVTATYDDGKERTVEGTITSATSSLTGSVGINKGVTVSYSEGEIVKEANFTIDVASYQFTETVQDYVYPTGETGTMSGGTYKKFGDWPQTIKGADVTVGSGTLVRGGLTYHVGNDGNYYVKVTANPYDDGYTYSDKSEVTKDTEVYFKVEPIVWRVLTEDYKVPGENIEPQSTGKALLLAENILTGGIPYYSVYNVKRTIEGAEISPNNYEHSQIRAFLNGLSYEYKESDSTMQIQKNEYDGIGFLQTAFTPKAQELITSTIVDNSARSTNPDSNATLWNYGNNPFACGDTEDKIFLLSEQEATKEAYGFAEYNVYVGDAKKTTTSTRIRVTTDYAKATGADQSGWWRLRSPYYYFETNARFINYFGYAQDYRVDYIENGIVPALCIELQ